MLSAQFRRILFLLIALSMVSLGLVLIGQALFGWNDMMDWGRSIRVVQLHMLLPAQPSVSGGMALQETHLLAPAITAITTPTLTLAPTSSLSQIQLAASSPTPTATPVPSPAALPVTVGLDVDLPSQLLEEIAQVASSAQNLFTQASVLLTSTVRLDWNAVDGTPFYTQTFAATTRFDLIDPTLDWHDLQSMWQGEPLTYTAIAVLSDTLPALMQVLGPPGALITAQETITDLLSVVWHSHSTLAIVPFDQLVPRLAVFAIDGQNPVENAVHFDPRNYPLTATVYLHENNNATSEAELRQARLLLAQLPQSNRQPEHLTVIAMTGVTAMARMMGGQMDELGSDWPAEVVGPELASADLTVFSNEVAFSPDCETTASPEILLFCSKPEYWTTLEKSGVDLISLTGNHVNDWGRQSLSWTLDFYQKKQVTVYGGGSNAEEAVQPRIVVNHGNRIAFLGSNSVGPYNAWASESLPGAARFDFGQAAQMIQQARQDEQADVIFYDLQYLESYNPWPLLDQRNTFNMLLRDGADVVTGVQSHVPQAFEFTDGRLILFGLGNLYFDQMWGEATRQSLIVKHTIYEGRHISSQILVTILYDYGQPRWASTEERAQILQRLFAASYW